MYIYVYIYICVYRDVSHSNRIEMLAEQVGCTIYIYMCRYIHIYIERERDR